MLLTSGPLLVFLGGMCIGGVKVRMKVGQVDSPPLLTGQNPARVSSQPCLIYAIQNQD